MKENILFALIWIAPIIILLSTSYFKNVKLFLISSIVSFYLSFNLYVHYKYLVFTKNENYIDLIPKLIQSNRSEIFYIDYYGFFISFVYTIFISIIFWNLFNRKENNKFREFSKHYSFYLISFFCVFIYIILSINYKIVIPDIFSFFFAIFLLAKFIKIIFKSKKVTGDKK